MSADGPAPRSKEQPTQSPTGGEVRPETTTISPRGVPDEQAQTQSRRRSNPIARAAATAAAGYADSPEPERVMFGMTTSFAITIAASRTLNYIREQRRAMPKLRNVGRLLAQIPGNNSARVHHFLPGMTIGFTTGGTALLVRAGSLERWLSLPFGVGLALTTDELLLLVGRNNPYWGGERFALTQGAVASLASLGFGVILLCRGRPAEPKPHSLHTRSRATMDRVTLPTADDKE